MLHLDNAGSVGTCTFAMLEPPHPSPACGDERPAVSQQLSAART
jgi:hypothetical protein